MPQMFQELYQRTRVRETQVYKINPLKSGRTQNHQSGQKSKPVKMLPWLPLHCHFSESFTGRNPPENLQNVPNYHQKAWTQLAMLSMQENIWPSWYGIFACT